MDPVVEKFNILFSIRDAIIFSIIAAVLGFFLDYFFPGIKVDEPIWVTILLFFTQIIIGIVIVALLFQFYVWIFKQHPNTYFGFTVFTLIFFLVQASLFIRLSMVYHYFFHRNIISEQGLQQEIDATGHKDPIPLFLERYHL